MEFDFLIDQLEWEVWRIASAFEMDEAPVLVHLTEANQTFKGSGNGFRLVLDFSLIAPYKGLWHLELSEGPKRYIELTRESGITPPIWTLNYEFPYRARALMVRALYRLGFEDESILNQLPALSAHEKMELRLSMPHEFWPQKWIEKEQ